MKFDHEDELVAYANAMMKYDVQTQESAKTKELLKLPNYKEFLNTLGLKDLHLEKLASEYQSSSLLKSEFSDALLELTLNLGNVAGDLRLHSFTLYCLVRHFEPRLVVETGVASGKSSAVILEALRMNGVGRLISIDLPNKEGQVLPDGAATHTGNKSVGWLVPDYLRDNWELLLGDSVEILSELIEPISDCEFFFHDSLHTTAHVLAEYYVIRNRSTNLKVAVIDDVDTGAGVAARCVAECEHKELNIYRDLGVITYV